MMSNDFDRFDALMQGVSDCFGQTLTAQGIALRFKVLAAHSIDDVERAAMSLIIPLPISDAINSCICTGSS